MLRSNSLRLEVGTWTRSDLLLRLSFLKLEVGTWTRSDLLLVEVEVAGDVADWPAGCGVRGLAKLQLFL